MLAFLCLSRVIEFLLVHGGFCFEGVVVILRVYCWRVSSPWPLRALWYNRISEARMSFFNGECHVLFCTVTSFWCSYCWRVCCTFVSVSASQLFVVFCFGLFLFRLCYFM